jgi:hypothetical protein
MSHLNRTLGTPLSGGVRLTHVRSTLSTAWQPRGASIGSSLRRAAPLIEPLVRLLLLGLWVFLLVDTILNVRPDLLSPADLGTDPSNYVAAAERLVESGRPYVLAAGQRPAPADNPPFWTAPILSPPTTAALWEATLLLPDAARFHVTWLLGALGVAGAGALLLVRAPLVLAIAAATLLPGLAITAWSGNVNALLVPAAMWLWYGSATASRSSSQVLTGGVIGALAAAKIAPAILIVWLVGQRRWRAVGAAILAVAALTGVALAQGGVQPFLDYLSIAADASATPDPGSIPGILRSVGLSPGIASMAYLGFLALIVLALVAKRSAPRSTFALAAVAMVFATPVVRLETLAVAIVAITPWLRGPVHGGRIQRWVEAGGIAAMLIASVLLSVSHGAGDRSSVVLVNSSDRPVTIRAYLPWPEATFGFTIEPGTSGVAWTARGAISGPLLAFDEACRFRSELWLPRTGGRVEFTSAGELRPSEEVLVETASLPFSSRCSGIPYPGPTKEVRG